MSRDRTGRLSSIVFVGLVALNTAFIAYSSPTLRAQTPPAKGWVEGVVLTEKGQPVDSWVTLQSKSGNGVRTYGDNGKGGFYTFRELEPGIYEAFVNSFVGQVDGKRVTYRPQHLFGIVVPAGKRTLLNLTVHSGEALEEIGKPTIASENAVNLADEFARIRKELNDLASLRRDVDVLAKQNVSAKQNVGAKAAK